MSNFMGALEEMQDRKNIADKAFEEATKRLAKHILEMDNKVSKMIGLMHQLEDICEGIVNAIGSIPKSHRTPTEQWIFEQLVGDASK